MIKFLRLGVSALVLSTVVLAPVVVIATADHAYAKNDGNGNSGGKGNGGGNAGGKGSSDKAHASSRGGKGGSKGGASAGKRQNERQATSLGQGIRNDFKSLGQSLKNGLFGGGTAKARRAPSAQTTDKTGPQRVSLEPTRKAPPKSIRPQAPASRLDAEPMLPRDLGKLNGALNSSPQAKLAHIANGSYATGTGPVSLAAALAVADYDLAAAEGSLAAYDAARDTLALADAFDLVENRPTEAEIIAARDTLENPDATEAERLAAQRTLDYPDTSAAEAEIAGHDRPTEAESTAARELVEAGPAPEGDLLAAAQAVSDAETAVLTASKDGLTPEQEQALLSSIRASNPEPARVGAALTETAPLDTGIEDLSGDALASSDAAIGDDGETIRILPVE